MNAELASVRCRTNADADDMRCRLEAPLAGKMPLAVTDNAATTQQAVDGALDKPTRLLDSTLGRQRDKRVGQKISASSEL